MGTSRDVGRSDRLELGEEGKQSQNCCQSQDWGGLRREQRERPGLVRACGTQHGFLFPFSFSELFCQAGSHAVSHASAQPWAVYPLEIQFQGICVLDLFLLAGKISHTEEASEQLLVWLSPYVKVTVKRACGSTSRQVFFASMTVCGYIARPATSHLCDLCLTASAFNTVQEQGWRKRGEPFA